MTSYKCDDFDSTEETPPNFNFNVFEDIIPFENITNFTGEKNVNYIYITEKLFKAIP